MKNKYPILLIASAFTSLQNCQYFTKLYLWNTYRLICIKEGDEWKTEFYTYSRHYEHLLMLFRLTNNPTVFQGLINDVLRDFLNQFVFVYLDDILIFSCTLEEHIRHVRLILQCPLKKHLYGKGRKKEFHQSSVQFLGFIVSWDHLEIDPEKTRAVAEWPTPETRKELQCSSTTNFTWTPKAESAYQDLKTRLSSAPVLTLADPEKQFVVEVDASDMEIRAVLSQERNYIIGDRELLAIKLPLEE